MNLRIPPSVYDCSQKPELKPSRGKKLVLASSKRFSPNCNLQLRIDCDLTDLTDLTELNILPNRGLVSDRKD